MSAQGLEALGLSTRDMSHPRDCQPSLSKRSQKTQAHRGLA